MSSSDAFRHTYRINRIIVETAEIEVTLFGEFSEAEAREIAEQSIDRGYVHWKRAVRTDVQHAHSVPMWAVEAAAERAMAELADGEDQV